MRDGGCETGAGRGWRERSVVVAAGAVLIVAASGALIAAQRTVPPTTSGLAFEVAAVAPNRSDDPPTSRFPLGIGDAFTPGAFFRATNQPLIAYLRFAFKVTDFQGLPAWVNHERFDIDARAAGSPSKDDMRGMMQSLLVDRFGLVFHTERRTGAGLALQLVTRGATGPNLRRAEASGCSASQAPGELIPCGRIGPSVASSSARLHIAGRSISLARLAAFLTNPATGIARPVFDRTGLSGFFDIDLEWTADPDAPSTNATDLTFAQALHDQLGLQLRSTKGTVDALRIDRIQRPPSD